MPKNRYRILSDLNPKAPQVIIPNPGFIPLFSATRITRVETFRRFALAQLGVSLAWGAAANVSTTKKEKEAIRADLVSLRYCIVNGDFSEQHLDTFIFTLFFQHFYEFILTKVIHII